MTEERKFAILTVATILSARRIQESIMSDKPEAGGAFNSQKPLGWPTLLVLKGWAALLFLALTPGVATGLKTLAPLRSCRL